MQVMKVGQSTTSLYNNTYILSQCLRPSMVKQAKDQVLTMMDE